MNPNCRKAMHRSWGPIFLMLFLLLWVCKCLCHSFFGLSLRSVPQVVLIWLGVGATSAFLLWLNLQLRRIDPQSKPAWIQRAMTGVKPASIIVVLVLLPVAFMASITSYHREEIVEKDGCRLVARAGGFFGRSITYYRYTGPLFYGPEIPADVTPEPSDDESVPPDTPLPGTEAKRLDISVLENREDELVFSVSMEDFIDSYNAFYEADHGRSYLSLQSEWQRFSYDTGVHSGHRTLCYYFTEDRQVYSLPTVTVYVPENRDCIQEITVNYDEHSYSEAGYTQYKQMCCYTLQVFFPELSEEAILALCTEAVLLGNQHIFLSDAWYGNGSVPYALFYKDGIGVYPYFAIGDWERLCVIPVTEDTIAEFQQRGVEIHEIP